MIYGDVADQLATQLQTITGLRVFAYEPDTLVPPAAVVTYPEEIEFDGTYQRGMDVMTLTVSVYVPRLTDRTTRDLISAYADGSGTSSIKAVLEAGTYTAFEVVVVKSVKFQYGTIGGTDVLAADFALEITGSGS